MSFWSNAWNAQKQSLADLGSYIDYAGSTPQAQSVIKAIPEMGASEWLQSLSPSVQANTTDTQPTNFIRQTQPAPTNTPTSNTAYTASPVPGTTLQIPQSPQVQSSTPDYSQEIANIYNPAYSSLNAQESLLGGQQQTARADLTQQSKELEDSLGLQTKQIQGDVQVQKQDQFEEKRDAMSQARRMYSDLVQQGKSRYGMGSSTGGAVSELIGREYMSNAGDIRKSYSKNMGALTSYANRVSEWSVQQSQSIKKNLDIGLSSIRDEFNERMSKITVARNTLDSAKAQEKLSVMRDAVARTQSLQDAKDKALFDLSIWQKQQESLVNSGVSQLNDDYTNTLRNQSEAEVKYSQPESSEQRTYNNLYQNPFLDNSEDDELASNTYSSQYFT